jgi:hypothetical protein
MTYRYPDSDLHDPGKILGLTGSFWSGRSVRLAIRPSSTCWS